MGEFDGVIELQGTAVDAARGRVLSALFDAPARARPKTLQHYEIRDVLGRGAMGVVYRAFDPKLERDVAIKLIAMGRDRGPQARARLLREAKALAKIQHANVVAVHDVGAAGEDLFVVMDYVAGQSLAGWLDASPRPWSTTLPLFIEAGRGLEAAHAAGVLHRDFKPSNVLVTAEGHARVVDFGLARTLDADAEPAGPLSDPPAAQPRQRSGATDPGPLGTAPGTEADVLTRAGVVMGTPAYMSPEQFAGEPLDGQSDQFSFCVSLFEGLYGMRPFRGGTLESLSAAVARGRAQTPPSSADVPGWLHAVVMRGLAPDPRERWPSMGTLLDALAFDPSAKRRRVAVLGVVVVSLGVGAYGLASAADAPEPCSGGSDELAGVWDGAQEQEIRAALRATAVGHAEATADRVVARLDAYAAAWGQARVDACAATRVRGEQSTELMDRRMACLGLRRTELRSLTQALLDADPGVAARAVTAAASLSAIDACADARSLGETMPAPSDPALAAAVDAVRERLAEARGLERAGRFADGLAVARAASAEAREHDYPPLLALASSAMGRLQRRTDAYDDARASQLVAYGLAVEHRMTAVAADIAAEMMAIATLQGAFESAESWAVHAVPLARAVGPDSSRLGRTLDVLAALAHAQGESERAARQWEAALEVLEAALPADHPQIAATRSNLGHAALALGKYDDAERLYVEALAGIDRALGSDHPTAAAIHEGLGGIAVSRGQYEAAWDRYVRVERLRSERFGSDAVPVGAAHSNLGLVATHRGEHARARGHFERALAIYERALGPAHARVGLVHANLGWLARREGDDARARQELERALEIRRAALGPDHPAVADSLHRLGAMLVESEPAAARAHLLRAVEIRRGALGDTHRHTADSLAALGNAVHQLRDYEEARVLHTEAVHAYEAALGRDAPRLRYALIGLGRALLELGRPADALEPLERAVALPASESEVLDEANAELTELLARARTANDSPP